jgi:hypothetical protein
LVSGLYYEAASMMLPGGLCYWQAKLIKLFERAGIVGLSTSLPGYASGMDDPQSGRQAR